MSTDLERQIVVPYSGEVVSLSADTDVLAALSDEIKDVESRLRELKAAISTEVHERMDKQRKWTMAAGPFKLTGKSDAPEVEYDPDRLAAVLTQLVDEGEITRDAMDEAIEPLVGWKVKRAGINALRKSPRFAPLIDSCGEEKPPENRRLSVKRVAS